MKSFQNFVNIVERTTPGFGKPTGYDAQGEPMYTRRPGPRQKGRRAGVQRSPKSVTTVKGEIEAAKGFGSVKSGGLDTRPTDPKFTAAKRDPRVAALGGNVWDDPTPAPGRPFKSLTKQSSISTTTSTTLRTKTGGTSGRDWLASLSPESSKSDPWKGGDYVSGDESRRRMANNPTEPFGDSGFDPHGSQKGSPQPRPQSKPSAAPEATKPKSPEPVKQSVVSQQAKQYRASQKTVDVSAKPVGTKFAEPITKPKGLPGLSSEPAGPLATVRKGESQTIRPQKGPGRTGILGAPKAGVLTGAPKIEPVKIREIKPPVTASNRIPAVKPATSTPTPAKPATSSTRARTGGRVRLRTPRASVITPSALEKALTNNRQQTALAQQAQNTRASVQNAKALKNVARVGTGVAAYFDFQRASQAAKERGAGERRATARGAVEAGARVLGTTAGFIAGTPLGPAGQAVGGIGGGEYAVRKSGQAFEKIFGKPGDAVTRQSVKRNIKSVVREKIPQNIRSQVPTSVKKGFSSFLDTAADAAKKGYGLYRKGRKLMDFSNPGDK